MQPARVRGHSVRGGALTELILEVFRLNGRLLRAGDALVADIGIGSARWQVLGAIALSAGPQPVANLARVMGLTRQAVQRVVNELEAEGFVRFADNPHHRRAKLVIATEKGASTYRAASARQVPWANRLAAGLPPRDIETTRKVMRALAEKLEAEEFSPPAQRARPWRRRRSPR
jgi:DNA-binding MarR family transcriptional regulator